MPEENKNLPSLDVADRVRSGDQRLSRCSGLFCECVNWCRAGRDMFSPHHPHCEKYTPPPTDPRFARFGESMWKFITKKGGDFCGDELSEDILPLAQAAGLCCRIEYDPELHGEGIEADPGDEIWWWGDNFADCPDVDWATRDVHQLREAATYTHAGCTASAMGWAIKYANIQDQLYRIAKEGFGMEDTIGGESCVDYVLRRLGKSPENVEFLDRREKPQPTRQKPESKS